MLVVLAASAHLLSGPAWAQGGERKASVGTDAVDAVSQPLTDLNLRNKEIPMILRSAQAAPYDLAMLDDCRALHGEIGRLDAVLGPDADAPPDKDGLANKGLQLGGAILGGLIPFRGLVRQLSGANAQRERWQSAIYSGVARRSFLKGYTRRMGCPTVEETAKATAQEILGLGN